MNMLLNLMYFLVCCYVTVLPLVNENYGTIGKIPDIILMLLLLLYLIYNICSIKSIKRLIENIKEFSLSLLGGSIIILAILMLISTSYAVEKDLSILESFRFITYIALIFIIKYEFKDDKKIKTLIKCFIVSTAIIVAIGIIQYFTGIGLNEKFILEEGNRITATMQNPNGYGAYLVLSFFPILMLTFSNNSKKINIFYVIMSCFIIINILLTYSRNSLLGFVVGILILSVIYNYKILYGFGVILILLFLDKKLLYRFSNIKNSFLNDPRIKLWQTASKMIKEHPIIGVGNGNYVALYDEYVKKYPECVYPDYHRFSSHNSYLKVQSELGILGIVVFLTILFSAIKDLFNAYKLTQDKYLKMFLLGAISSVAGFLVMNLLDNLFFSPQTTTYFWLFIAISQNIIFRSKKITYKYD